VPKLTNSELADEWLNRLRPELGGYARLAMENIAREFPSHMFSVMTAPGDFPHRPRDRTPVFFGSFDWHSCVEMHWVLVRLLKAAPEAVPAAEIRETLDAQFTAEGLRQEAEFMRTKDGGQMQRPYGWGWALADRVPAGHRRRRAALAIHPRGRLGLQRRVDRAPTRAQPEQGLVLAAASRIIAPER
jgi:hypothetical protein